jgi:hypothetical protein
MRRCFLTLLFVLAPFALLADGPQDNVPDKVRPIPPAGVAIPDAERKELETSTESLGKLITELQTALAKKPALLELLPDVQIYHNAARYALAHNEFFDAKDAKVARDLLEMGHNRASALRDGKSPWTTETGLVVRGYRSKIDDSVQPYGLVVPASYQPGGAHQHRLDIWCHGRGEQLSELRFLNDRQKNPGEFTSPHTFVLHPYGRYCNANKFAGEIDVLEAIAHARKHYPIDENRIVMRGFSMGGAACWQFAVHYPSLWVAAAPGAGFSETPDFLKVFQNEELKPTWYEQKLWHLYDCTDYALNLVNLPTVAYSGEIDKQKQAADMMARAMKKEGIELVHLIGPNTPHRYHPETKKEINRRIDAVAALGRNPVPRHVQFTTWTLRYPEAFWVRLEGLEKHWERATIDAVLETNKVKVKPKNVTAFTLSMGPGQCPFAVNSTVEVEVNDHKIWPALGQSQEITRPKSDRSWSVHVRKGRYGTWVLGGEPPADWLAKKPGLQGPIDDAFMDSFLMVRPTGKGYHDATATWIAAEMEHAVDHWRKQFRGEARVKHDAGVTADDIAAHNLVLWGDPASNQILAKIADRLPIRWNAEQVVCGKEMFDAATHVPVLIYPNPLNPKRYVVLNSGFTFREYDYLNNARQVPKLPDFAVLDTRVPRTLRLPAGVATAGFFDEQWKLPAQEK